MAKVCGEAVKKARDYIGGMQRSPLTTNHIIPWETCEIDSCLYYVLNMAKRALYRKRLQGSQGSMPEARRPPQQRAPQRATMKQLKPQQLQMV